MGKTGARTKRTLLICLLLIVGTAAVYARVSHDGFLKYDDDQYVTDNWHVRAGLHWSTVKWAFTSFEEANWHPLTWLSHALDCQLFGLNPARQHEMNLAFHVANAVLLFLLLLWMTGCMWRSLVVAALFAVHPINVESVAWIAERKTLLCMFFFLLTLLAYVRYVRKANFARYSLVLLLFAAALMAKPLAITLPFVLLLLDYWPLKRGRFGPANETNKKTELMNQPVTGTKSITWLILEKIPLFCLSAGSAALTLKAQSAAGAVAIRHSALVRFENALVSYALYLGKAIWPAHLALLYPYPMGGWRMWAVVLSGLLLIAITVLAVKFRSRPYLTFGWFWFVGTMIPMIGVVQVGNQAMADRYAYLPFIGLLVIAVWGLAELGNRFRVPWRYGSVIPVLIVAAFSFATYHQLRYWRDDYSVWSHTLAITRDNFVAEDNVGEALIRQGKYYEGIAHFRAAAAIEPADPVSEINLGIYEQQQGNLREAIARYEYGLQLTVNRQLRATAYANLGSVYFMLHDYQRAAENFDSAVKLKGVFPFIYRDLGVIVQKSGDWKRASEYYALYTAAEPSDVAYLLLGDALEKIGDTRRADEAFRRAKKLSKNMAETQQEVDKLLQ